MAGEEGRRVMTWVTCVCGVVRVYECMCARV